MCWFCVDETGNFEIPIEWVFWESSKKRLSEYIAVMYLPQLGNDILHATPNCAPMSWVLDFDENRFGSFIGITFVSKSQGHWLCSEGGTGVSSYNFSRELARFPESYHTQLNALHKQRPHWQFYAKECNFDFDSFVTIEIKHGLVCTSIDKYGYSPKVTGSQYDPGCHKASESAVRYFIDPRNHLNTMDIFQF